MARSSALPAGRRRRAGAGAAPGGIDGVVTRGSDGSAMAAGRAGADASLELDRLIHERTRLGIVSALAVNDTLSFSELKALLRTTDGNLSVHARKLELADYVVCTKLFEGRVPRTRYRLTSGGRRALERYLNHMEALIRATRSR